MIAIAIAILLVAIIILWPRGRSKLCGSRLAFGGHIGDTASAMGNHTVGPAVAGYEYVHGAI